MVLNFKTYICFWGVFVALFLYGHSAMAGLYFALPQITSQIENLPLNFTEPKLNEQQNYAASHSLLQETQSLPETSEKMIMPPSGERHSLVFLPHTKKDFPVPGYKPLFPGLYKDLLVRVPMPELKPEDRKNYIESPEYKLSQSFQDEIDAGAQESTGDPHIKNRMHLAQKAKEESNDPVKQINAYPLPDLTELSVDTVLVPQTRTVISSTRDDVIRKIAVKNGDRFYKGEVLLEYKCADLNAQSRILSGKEKLADEKEKSAKQLFKLNMISRAEKMELQTQSNTLEGEKAKLKARKERCEIRAPYDGYVIEKLANENEYTRTERVLLEIVKGTGPNAELLLPSRWLRWINTGAPLNIYIEEIDKVYEARIIRLHGRVDPASKTVQVVARLQNTKDRLLPGMSGQATLDLEKIRQSGITGYLEQSREF